MAKKPMIGGGAAMSDEPELDLEPDAEAPVHVAKPKQYTYKVLDTELEMKFTEEEAAEHMSRGMRLEKLDA